MKKTVLRALVVAAILPTPALGQAAGIVFEGGTVHVMDAHRTTASALAIRNGKIIFVGTAQGAEAALGPGARKIDLHGGALFPGFTDAHVHPEIGGEALLTLDVSSARTPEALKSKVRAYADAHSELKFVTGAGWNGNPDKSLLDAVVPNRPVILVSEDVHSTLANSKALAMAGINRNTPDPEAGRIEHDPKTGEPTGVLRDRAGELVSRLVPPLSLEERIAAVRRGLQYENSHGYTAVIDAASLRGWEEAYLALENRGGMTVRASLSLIPGDILMQTSVKKADVPKTIEELARRRATVIKRSSGLVSANFVKIFMDGVIENWTAAMLDPYHDTHASPPLPANYAGELRMPPDTVNAYVTALDRAGFQVHFHAIGDLAARAALDAVAAAVKTNGPRDRRDTIAHLQVVQPGDFPRFKALGIYENIQPLWANDGADMELNTKPFISQRAIRYQYPFASIHNAGATLVVGSDWSVSTSDPMMEMHVAVNRKSFGSHLPALGPEQALSVDDVIAGLTIHGAELTRQEAIRGTLTAGKQADLVALDNDPYSVPKDKIGTIKIRQTWLGGKEVYAAK